MGKLDFSVPFTTAPFWFIPSAWLLLHPESRLVFGDTLLKRRQPEIGLQAQIIDSELTAKLLGRGVAVSPVVTVEPRRRKFHKAITLSMPAPRPHTQGMTNQYSTSSAPTLRLLCSISGMLFKLASIILMIRSESVAGSIIFCYIQT